MPFRLTFISIRDRRCSLRASQISSSLIFTWTPDTRKRKKERKMWGFLRQNLKFGLPSWRNTRGDLLHREHVLYTMFFSCPKNWETLLTWSPFIFLSSFFHALYSFCVLHLCLIHTRIVYLYCTFYLFYFFLWFFFLFFLFFRKWYSRPPCTNICTISVWTCHTVRRHLANLYWSAKCSICDFILKCFLLGWFHSVEYGRGLKRWIWWRSSYRRMVLQTCFSEQHI